MHFSSWLKKHIDTANITQKELAQAMQKSPGSVSNWFHDRHTPDNAEDILKLAEIFMPFYDNLGNSLLSLMLSIQYSLQHPVKSKK